MACYEGEEPVKTEAQIRARIAELQAQIAIYKTDSSMSAFRDQVGKKIKTLQWVLGE
jgi:hypothetical protein